MKVKHDGEQLKHLIKLLFHYMFHSFTNLHNSEKRTNDKSRQESRPQTDKSNAEAFSFPADAKTRRRLLM